MHVVEDYAILFTNIGTSHVCYSTAVVLGTRPHWDSVPVHQGLGGTMPEMWE